MGREKWEWWNGVFWKIRRQRLKKTYLRNAQLGEYQIVVLAI